MKSVVLSSLAAVVFGLVTASPTYAAIQSFYPNADVSSGAYTITLPPDDAENSTLVFNENLSGFDSTIGVATTGSAEVFSSFGAPAPFQVFAATNFPDDQLGSFQAYPSSTAIPFSVALGTIGFEFNEVDGVHYGLVAYGGTDVSSYFIDTVPGQNINLSVPYATPSAAPEPSAWAFMVIGLGGIGCVFRRAKREQVRQLRNAIAA